MSDLIDRQAAIDSMCELMRHWFGCDSKDEIREIKRELGKLPSAQPETANIIVGKSQNGMTMWYQCDNCNEPVDENDLYCRGCGRRFEHGSDR